MSRRTLIAAAVAAALAIAVGLLVRFARPVPEETRTPRTVVVYASRGWQDTGVFLGPGRRFRLRYVSGEIRDRETHIPDANGTDYVCGNPGCCEPLPDVRRSALIGRVGGPAFAVGNGGEFEAGDGGQLLLRVNDCDEGLFDNSGELTVEFVP